MYLATVYYLGQPRPQAELAAMAPVRESLEGHLAGGDAERGAELELDAYQLHRLDEALLGVVNELKQFEMAQGRSAVPGFADAIRRLFPAVHPDAGGEPGAALDLTSEAMALHRRLGPQFREAEAEVARLREEVEQAERDRPRWWQVWRRRRDE